MVVGDRLTTIGSRDLVADPAAGTLKAGSCISFMPLNLLAWTQEYCLTAAYTCLVKGASIEFPPDCAGSLTDLLL